jgi:hypothetical protein
MNNEPNILMTQDFVDYLRIPVTEDYLGPPTVVIVTSNQSN